jgi:hypothetical protein
VWGVHYDSSRLGMTHLLVIPTLLIVGLNGSVLTDQFKIRIQRFIHSQGVLIAVTSSLRL